MPRIENSMPHIAEGTNTSAAMKSRVTVIASHGFAFEPNPHRAISMGNSAVLSTKNVKEDECILAVVAA